MVVKLVRNSVKEVRDFLSKLGLSVGRCFDDHELVSLLRSINTGDYDYWLLGWKEYDASDRASTFIVMLMDGEYREYVVKVLVSIGTIGITLPINYLDLGDDATGVTIMMGDGVAHISGRILCIRKIRVKRIP
jgi:hypothetical protein